MALSRAELNNKDRKALTLGKKGPNKFNERAQEIFLDHVRRTGKKHEAAKATGLSYHTVREYVNRNMFQMADRLEEALQEYRDLVEGEIHRRAIEGVPEPIIGGKDRDQIVTYVQRYSDRLLEFHARRHIPEYRQAQQVDLNIRGGVIAVPAQAPTIDAWASAASQATLPEKVEEEATPPED